MLKSQNSKKHTYIAIAVGVLMCLQRNAGVFIALGASLWLYIQNKNIKNNSIKPLAFFLFVVSGSFIWNFYVWVLLPHDHFNFSEKFFQYAIYNLSSMFSALVNTFVPIRHFSIPIVISALTFFVYSMRKQIHKNHAFQLIFILSVTYLIVLSLVLTVNIAGFRVDFGEGDRFISVIIPFLSIMIFKPLELFIHQKSTLTTKAFIILIIIWLAYPVTRTIKNAKQWHGLARLSEIHDKM